MKNRLVGLATATLPGVPGQMSDGLMLLVEQLTASGRKAMASHGTDLNLVCVCRGPSDDQGLTVASWRTPKGLEARAQELRDALKAGDLSNRGLDRVCIVGPHGPDGESNWFAYAEDSNGCWFSLLPVVAMQSPGGQTFGEPDWRPAQPRDGFYCVLPSVLN